VLCRFWLKCSRSLKIHCSCYGQCSSCRIRRGINRFGSRICFWIIIDDGESPETQLSYDKLLLEHTLAASRLHQHGWRKYQKRHNYKLRDDTASPLCFCSINCIPSLSRFLSTFNERSNYWRGGVYTLFAKEISNALGDADSGTSKSLSESAIMKGIIMRSIVCSSLLRRIVKCVV